jgi:hypothetical protein
MNLTKYFMIRAPMDDTFGPTDMPTVWNLKKYVWDKGHRMNYAGDSHDAHSVIMDSALGVLGAPPANKADFLAQVQWLKDYMSELPPPKYPFPVDKPPAPPPASRCSTPTAPPATPARRTGTPLAAGRSRHRPRPPRFVEQGRRDQGQPGGQGNGPGTPRPGRGRPDRATSPPSSTASGSRRPTCTTARCRPCATCSNPPPSGPKVFWRGYDVYDQAKVGFVSDTPEAQRAAAPGARHRQQGHWAA